VAKQLRLVSPSQFLKDEVFSDAHVLGKNNIKRLNKTDEFFCSVILSQALLNETVKMSYAFLPMFYRSSVRQDYESILFVGEVYTL